MMSSYWASALVISFGVAFILEGCGSPMEESTTTTTTTVTTPEWGTAECFVRPTYTDAMVTLQTVVYGSAYNSFTGQNESLILDLYAPPPEDLREARPAVVLMHGGVFFKGTRSSDGIATLARQLAVRGYVVASIDYRLATMPWLLMNSHSLQPASDAQEDARAAVRYLRMRAADLRIDSSRILIGGDSAGAISALYYAYVPDAPEGSSGNPGYSSSVRGVVSISGTMKFQAFCSDGAELRPKHCLLNDDRDLTPDIVSGSVPLVMMHGTADDVVPYAGAREMLARAQLVDVRSELITAPGVGHVPHVMDALFDPTKAYMANLTTFMSGALDLRRASCPTLAPAASILV